MAAYGVWAPITPLFCTPTPTFDLNGLAIPKGDYTLYADLDNGQWKLIVNKTLMAGARHIWGVGVSPDGIRATDAPAGQTSPRCRDPRHAMIVNDPAGCPAEYRFGEC